MSTGPTADDLIRLLGLVPHPEGGHYRETFRDTGASPSIRGASTAIYFLLRAGEISRWHRIDAVEIWHWYAGAPLRLSVADGQQPHTNHRLGPDITAGQMPQIVVPAGHWQQAESQGPYTLVGCTVAPAFEFAGFEMAAPGWRPN